MELVCALLVSLALALLRATSANVFQHSICLVPKDDNSYNGTVCSMHNSEVNTTHLECDRTGRPSATYWNESKHWLSNNANYTIDTEHDLVTFKCDGEQCHDGGSDMWVYKNDVKMDVFPATYVLSAMISQDGFDEAHNDETGSGIIAWQSSDHKITAAYHHSGNFKEKDVAKNMAKVQVYAIDFKQGVGIYKMETLCKHHDPRHASLRVYVDTIGGRVVAMSRNCKRSWQLRPGRNFMQGDLDMSLIGLEVARVSTATFTDLTLEGCDTPRYVESIFVALVVVTTVVTLVAAWFVGMQPWRGTKKADQITAMVCGANLMTDVTAVVIFALLPEQGTDAMLHEFPLWWLALVVVLMVIIVNGIALLTHWCQRISSWPSGKTSHMTERHRTWVVTAVFNAELARLYLSALEIEEERTRQDPRALQLQRWKTVLSVVATFQCLGMLALTCWVLHEIPDFCISAFRVLIFGMVMSIVDLLLRPVSRLLTDLCGFTCGKTSKDDVHRQASSTTEGTFLMYDYYVKTSSYEGALNKAARSGVVVSCEGYHRVDKVEYPVAYKLSFDTLQLRKRVQHDWDAHRPHEEDSSPEEAANHNIFDYFECRVEQNPMTKTLGVLVVLPGRRLDDDAGGQQNGRVDNTYERSNCSKTEHTLQHEATLTYLHALNGKLTNLTGILVHRFVTLDGPSMIMLELGRQDDSLPGVVGVQFKGRTYTLWLVCPVCDKKAECGPANEGFKLVVVEDTSLVPQIMQAASYIGKYMNFATVDLKSIQSALVKTVTESSDLVKKLSTIVKLGRPTEVNRKFLRGLLDKLDGAWAMLGLKEVVHATSHMKEYVCNRCAALYEVLGDEARAFVAHRHRTSDMVVRSEERGGAREEIKQVEPECAHESSQHGHGAKTMTS